MKLNLHVPFKAWNGEEIKERKGEEEKANLGYLAIQFIGGKLLFRDHLGIRRRTDKIPAEKKQGN